MEPVGTVFDRLGSPYGKCVGQVNEDGSCAKVSQRSIPYYFEGDDATQQASYHRYVVKVEITKSNLESQIMESSLPAERKNKMIEAVNEYYDTKVPVYGKSGNQDGLAYGEIASMFGEPGGGYQYDMPLNMNDLYDIIDTVLLKHHTIDVIGIATPGIIKDNQHLRSSIDDRNQDIKNEFEKKYHIDVFIYNNANAAVVGFSLEHEEYKNIIFHSQPFGFGVGGQGILVNGQVITGKEGIAGEVRFFLRRMQLSDDCQQLAWSQAGVKELVIKSLLPSISLIGPDAIALYSPMTPDTLEIEKGLLSFVPKEFIPTFYSIKEPWYYMLDGITKLCMDHLEENHR